RVELYEIYIEGIKLNFINKQYEITINGIQFLKELKEKTNPENFRKETKYNLRVKSESYIPIQLNGLT
ncbi:hypothetical protein, partial [Tenacibaculum maritimum]